jgi:hypothetical protein
MAMIALLWQTPTDASPMDLHAGKSVFHFALADGQFSEMCED